MEWKVLRTSFYGWGIKNIFEKKPYQEFLLLKASPVWEINEGRHQALTKNAYLAYE